MTIGVTTMSGEPTDLIREATDALAGITPGPWTSEDTYVDTPALPNNDYVAISAWSHVDARFIAAAQDLVRRLRDALGMSERQVRNKRDQIDVMSEVGERIARERDELRADLAEANATIKKAMELAVYLESESGTTDAAIRRSVATEFRRAIEGPAT